MEIELPEHPTHVIFGGGGSKGACHVGFIKMLEEFYEVHRLMDIKSLECITGTSIGCVLGLFTMLGLNSDIILSMLLNYEETILNNDIDIDSCLSSFGMHDPRQSVLYSTILKVMHDHELTEDITYEQLYEYTGMHFTTSGVCLNTQSTVYFSDILTPQMKVSDGVLISMSIPLLFQTFLMDGNVYIDGGILESLPFGCITHPETTISSMMTSGAHAKRVEVTNVEDYVLCLLKSIEYEPVSFEHKRTECVSCLDVHTNCVRSPLKMFC